MRARSIGVGLYCVVALGLAASVVPYFASGVRPYHARLLRAGGLDSLPEGAALLYRTQNRTTAILFLGIAIAIPLLLRAATHERSTNRALAILVCLPQLGLMASNLANGFASPWWQNLLILAVGVLAAALTGSLS